MSVPRRVRAAAVLATLALLAAAGACHRDTPDRGPPPGADPGPASAPAAPPRAAPTSSDGLPTVQPAELASALASAPADARPLLIHVGFRKLYQQAHIPGSEFYGPTSDDAVLASLRQRLDGLPRTTPLVIYCGCCPWDHCPNVAPAARLVQDMGFTAAKLLYIPHDLGTDWVAKGYPVASGD